jgi:SAM-dependent methyltransferase
MKRRTPSLRSRSLVAHVASVVPAAPRLRAALGLIELRALAARPFRCPACGPSLLVRIAAHPIGVRCLRCGASAITLSLMTALIDTRPHFQQDSVYELSSRGPLVTFLRERVPDLTCSEYFDDVPPGERRNGVQCQDVERLTFGDASFDLCTSTEVFEHVPDDRQGFREVRRVLKPGGVMMFTVPLTGAPATIERARLEDGHIVHLLPPEYHGDRIRGAGNVLAFRNYGEDIIDRLRGAGFASATIDWRFRTAFLGHGSGVVVARV